MLHALILFRGYKNIKFSGINGFIREKIVSGFQYSILPPCIVTFFVYFYRLKKYSENNGTNPHIYAEMG